ncbi:MAG TPA: NfeD family protein [Planctomycetaceae bacterium]|jgi:membrane-bound ClpP family serine protease|nr:NfeD family protein [Planctomycetaceae bacterium]
MDSGYLAILLLVVGLALIVCEVFIPSAGLIATLATLCIAGSVAAAWSAWASSHPTYFALYALALLILIPSAISSAFYLLPRTAFGRKVLLEAPDLDEVTPYQEEQRQLLRLVGHVGKTLTLLNPGGLVEVNGTRQHCESEGLLLEAGTPVEIVAVKGNSVVVRPVEHRPSQASDADLKRDQSAGESLDFDLPRS